MTAAKRTSTSQKKPSSPASKKEQVSSGSAASKPIREQVQARPRPPEQRGDEPEITAQPMSLAEELSVHHRNEEGLSIEPEDMGRQYLNDAMEEGDFEAVPDVEDDELNIVGGTRSDQAMTGPNIEPDDDIWENTVNETLEAGSSEDALDELAPARAAVEREGGTFDDEADDAEEQVDELDLTEANVHEASLFDHEGNELGEVESPELNTEDAHHSRIRRRIGPAGQRT